MLQLECIIMLNRTFPDMPKREENLPELLNINQVAKILNVHPVTLGRWDKSGKLKALRVGTRRGVGERRYRKEDIIKLIT